MLFRSNTSATADVYARGTAQLSGGTVFVPFANDFKNTIGGDVVVTISAMGENKGLYVSSVTNNGFYVKESGTGESNVKISWIAVGERKDAADLAISPELLDKSFDENMREVMKGEGDVDAKSVWFDGQNIQFSKIEKGQIEKGRTNKPALAHKINKK